MDETTPHLGIEKEKDCHDNCNDSPILLMEDGACLLYEDESAILLEQ